MIPVDQPRFGVPLDEGVLADDELSPCFTYPRPVRIGQLHSCRTCVGIELTRRGLLRVERYQFRRVPGGFRIERIDVETRA